MTCGPNAACFAKDHVAHCQCKPTYVGDAYNIRVGCKRKFGLFEIILDSVVNRVYLFRLLHFFYSS